MVLFMAYILDQEFELTLTELADRFGPMPASRIRRNPRPGTATIDDLLAIHHEDEGKLCELVDAVLVQKTAGFRKAILAAEIGFRIANHVHESRSGLVAGAGGMFRLAPQLVRSTDVSFLSWDRLPGGKVPHDPAPSLAPNLAVDVLTTGNTEKEMARKLEDYFDAGVELVWFVDPPTHTIKIFTGRDAFTLLNQNQTLTGGTVLPGFELKVASIFAKLDEIYLQ